MKSIDSLLGKKYSSSYHCVHFVIDAAEYLLGLDYSQNFIGFTSSLHESLKAERRAMVKNKKIEVPIQGCIVRMKNAKGGSHVGLFYCDKILHLTELGVHYLPKISLEKFYKDFTYYDPCAYLSKPT